MPTIAAFLTPTPVIFSWTAVMIPLNPIAIQIENTKKAPT